MPLSKAERAGVGRSLKVWRSRSFETQKSASQKLKIGKWYLSALENGHKTPSLDLLFAAIALYGVDLEPALSELADWIRIEQR